MDFLDKKMKRWMMGHVEKDAYMLTWIFFPQWLTNFSSPHPRGKHPLRSIGTLLVSILRMYMIFALPLNVVPCIYSVLPRQMNDANFHWLTVLQILPQQTPWLQLSVPTLVVQGDQNDALHWCLLSGYWALLPAGMICVALMFGIQVRIYRSFKFLRFDFRTLMLYPLVFVPVMLAMGPLFLLWSYLKHGILNRPAGHVMMTGKQTTEQNGDDEIAKDEIADIETISVAPSTSSSELHSHDSATWVFTL